MIQPKSQRNGLSATTPESLVTGSLAGRRRYRVDGKEASLPQIAIVLGGIVLAITVLIGVLVGFAAMTF